MAWVRSWRGCGHGVGEVVWLERADPSEVCTKTNLPKMEAKPINGTISLDWPLLSTNEILM